MSWKTISCEKVNYEIKCVSDDTCCCLQTLISLFNLSQDKFYYNDEIVNVFLEKMHHTIGGKVKKHVENVRKSITGSAVPRLILEHILTDKLGRSACQQIRESAKPLTPPGRNTSKQLQSFYFKKQMINL